MTTNSANECVKKIEQLCSTARSVYANAQIGVSSLTERYNLSVRDRGAIFGLRGPNAELPIGGGKLSGATTIGINKLPLEKSVFHKLAQDRKAQNYNTVVELETSHSSYQNDKITAKMLMRRSYVTLGITIDVTLLIRECSTGYN